MQRDEVRLICDHLPKGKTRFYYFRDRYALLLLSLAVKNAVSKKDLQKSRFGKLLGKTVVKESISHFRGRDLSAEAFNAWWPARYECYFLSVGVWGSNSRYWDQTSRSGHNLVLQLNFSSKHDDLYRELIDPQAEYPFEYRGHPIAKGSRHTLAWARLDIDRERSEALIEEIQNDWIRNALTARRRAIESDGNIRYGDTEMRRDRIIRYVDSVLRQHEETWDEAMLAATIVFLREELGIETIYYHTHESGAALKKISYRLPPRSLYTQLPRKFCFVETDDKPAFLHVKAKSSRSRKALDSAKFFRLTF